MSACCLGCHNSQQFGKALQDGYSFINKNKRDVFLTQTTEPNDMTEAESTKVITGDLVVPLMSVHLQRISGVCLVLLPCC